VAKPSLSPSKITTYLACPTKYYWTYIDPRGRYYLKSKHYYSFGTTLHRVLQQFHDEQDRGVTTVADAVRAVDENWVAAGYTSAEHMAEAAGEGREIISKYVQATLEKPREGRVLYLERQIQTDLGPFRLIGRVDRVDELPDGTWDIIDYKSGRSTVTSDEISTDIAMSCYQLILRRRFPERSVRATIVAIRTGEAASYALTDEEIGQFEQDLLTLGEEILNAEWDGHEPSAKTLCAACDFLPLCRKSPEFSESLAAI